MVGGSFKEFLPKFWEEKEFRPKFRFHRILAEISGRKGISAKPKPKSKIGFGLAETETQIYISVSVSFC